MTSTRATIRGAVTAAMLLVGSAGLPAVGADTPQTAIAAAARAVVKVYGAGGLRGLESYQSGIVVSPTGRIVTAAGTVLDGAEVDCVLDDGSRHRATLVGIDPHRELAVLQIEAADLPCFALVDEEPAAAGTRVLALSNLFGVAVGDERVSAQRGVVAAVAFLEARRGPAEAPFTGEVIVLDVTTNNPGSAGGAIVDSRGRLLGILGKELRTTESGLWLNYALPTREVVRALRAVEEGKAAAPPPGVGGAPVDLARYGATLVPDLLDQTPPFIDAVEPGSPADRAGLRVDDLVIAVGSRAVRSRRGLERELGQLAPGDAARLAVIRAGTIVECDLGPRPDLEGSP